MSKKEKKSKKKKQKKPELELKEKVKGMGKMSIQALYRILRKNNAGKYPQPEQIMMSDRIESKLAQLGYITLHNPVIGGGWNWELTEKAKKLLPSEPPAWWTKEEEHREQAVRGLPDSCY